MDLRVIAAFFRFFRFCNVRNASARLLLLSAALSLALSPALLALLFAAGFT
jgi:hypothetical protein